MARVFKKHQNFYKKFCGFKIINNFKMPKTYNNFYSEIYSIHNLLLVYRKARKGKTKKPYVSLILFQQRIHNAAFLLVFLCFLKLN
jgi:hypothetical protein